jgi:transposase
MSSVTLSEYQWAKILAFLRSCAGVYVGKESNCRRFIEAVLYQARSGAQWRLLPERYGPWNSIYKRFARWCERGIWEALLAHVAQEPDLECLLLDSTVIRAHPCAAGAPVTQGGQAAQALGRSRGGFSTKTHVVVDGLGNPLDFVLTPGQAHDVKQGPRLLHGRHSDYVIADKAYDADYFIELIEAMGAIPVIPARSHRTELRYYDPHLYKERHLVECFINKIKWYRRIFARFDKLATRFLGFLAFVATLIWLR